MTGEPGSLWTGRLSPWCDDGLVDLALTRPSTIPSTGTFAPRGEPAEISDRDVCGGTSMGVPSRSRKAFGGERSRSARIASLAPPRGSHFEPMTRADERREHADGFVKDVATSR